MNKKKYINNDDRKTDIKCMIKPQMSKFVKVTLKDKSIIHGYFLELIEDNYIFNNDKVNLTIQKDDIISIDNTDKLSKSQEFFKLLKE